MASSAAGDAAGQVAGAGTTDVRVHVVLFDKRQQCQGLVLSCKAGKLFVQRGKFPTHARQPAVSRKAVGPIEVRVAD